MLQFSYAKEVVKICQQLNDARCIGCQYNNLSSQYHDCLTNSKYQVYSYHFDEAIKVLDFDRISQLFDKVVSNLDIPTIYVKQFQDSFNWDWWKENNDDKHKFVSEIQEVAQLLSVVTEM